MKKTMKIAMIVMIGFLSVMGVHAQEWTKQQLEVWKTVESEWNLWKSKDITGMTAILHEKYQGWNGEFPLPVSKAMTIEYFTMMKDAFVVDAVFLNPARIVVTESSAVVHYFYSYNLSFGSGDDKQSKEYKGRIVEFYTKEGGKWQLLGDMMVSADDEEEEDD